MKLMKKISAVLLSLCLLVPCFSMVVDAADGRISFTDPSTAVGEYVEVKCVLRSTSGNMGDVEVELIYDETFLRFDSGDGITLDAEGELTCEGSAGAAEVSFVAKFQALQEGTTKVEIASATIADANGATLTLDQGNSTVTIAAGDPSKITEGGETTGAAAADLEVDVNGVTYTLTDEFADADIPNGYARTRRTLEGEERQMVENDNGSICLGYMRGANGTGDFFLYNEENATFSPYAEISISDTTSIVVLSDASQVSLPDHYQEAKLSLNEKEFPVWQDTLSEGMYIIYAMNSNGEIGYYQYDSLEGTYQRIEPAEAAAVEDEAANTDSFLGKVENFVKSHLSLVILVVGLGGILGIILLIILIVVSVKLRHRNEELDEFYDKYGIDDEEEEPAPVKKEKDTKKKRKQKEIEPEDDFEEVDLEEDDFEEDDFEEDDFEEDDFEEEFEESDFEETDFEEDDFEDFRETRSSMPKQQAEEFTGFTERMDFTIDDLDELLGEKSDKKRGHMEDDDTFKVDFIDLD